MSFIMEAVTFDEFALEEKLSSVLVELSSDGINIARRLTFKKIQTDRACVLPSDPCNHIRRTNVKIFGTSALDIKEQRKIVKVFQRYDFIHENTLSDRMIFGYCRKCLDAEYRVSIVT